MPAAGSGRRFGRSENKLFAFLDGEPLFLVTARKLANHARVSKIVMPVSRADLPRMQSEFGDRLEKLGVELVIGGAERTDSVQAGLDAIIGQKAIDLVAIHDAARPMICSDDLDAVFEKADETGAAILACSVTATVKQSLDDGQSCKTIDRSTLWLAQTPQVFRVDLLSNAYQRHRGRPATDDAELVQRSGVSVSIVPGSPNNLKITHPQDLMVAEAMIAAEKAGHAADHPGTETS